MKPAIRINNVCKSYRLGERRAGYSTLRDTIGDAFQAGWRRVRRGARASKPKEDAAKELIWALRGVTFEVAPGEVIGIVGRNGAGKSTLLKVLSRITEPTEGRIEILGRINSLLEVGTGFHPELTGRDNIYLNGTILGMKRREIKRKFDEIVAFSEIEEFLDTPVKRYSSGMYVRLAFSVAAHLEPDILVVDEVLAVGDAAFQHKCMGRMQEVGRGGRTVLFVSHNMAAVQNLCSRAVLLSKGEVRSIGDCSQVIAEYMKASSADAANGSSLESHRASGMQPLIQELELLDGDGRRTDCFPCGTPVDVKIRYHSPTPLVNARFGIRIDTMTGERLIFLQTAMQHEWIPEFPTAGVLHCRIPSLPLVPGAYTLTIGCSTRHQQLDLLDRVLTINVEKADFYGTGRLPSPQQARFLLHANWALE